MVNTTLLAAWLKAEEGFRPHPYTDTVGKLTIGIGRNLTDKGITAVEADILLYNDMRDATNALHSALPWVVGLDGVRSTVLADMVFNMGLRGLLTFTDLLGAVQHGNYEAAAAAMLASKWARQVGSRAETLAHRMKTGEV